MSAVRFLLSFAALAVCAEANAKSVLFVGNSYVYTNDLPGLFAAVAKSGEIPQRRTRRRRRPSPSSSTQRIRPRSRSSAPGNGTSSCCRSRASGPRSKNRRSKGTCFPAAQSLAKSVRESSPKAEVLFFETWGRRDGDEQNCKVLPDVCTYAGMQEKLNDSYRTIAEKNSARLSRVGEAWQKARKNHFEEIELYGPDRNHASVAGTYLAACVFYTAIFGKPCLGAGPLSLPAEQATALQLVADSVAP